MPQLATAPLWATGLVLAAVAIGFTPGNVSATPRDQEQASRSHMETASGGEAAASKDHAESLKAADSEPVKRKQDLRGMLLLWVLRHHPLQ